MCPIPAIIHILGVFFLTTVFVKITIFFNGPQFGRDERKSCDHPIHQEGIRGDLGTGKNRTQGPVQFHSLSRFKIGGAEMIFFKLIRS